MSKLAPSGVAIVSERALTARGGLAVATARIAAQAAARGERVHVVCWSGEAAPGARRVVQQDALIIHHVGRLERADDALMALSHHARDVVAAHDLDLVHGMYALHAGHAAVVAAAASDVASVVSLRGNDLDRGLFRAADLPWLDSALRRATSVTGVSRELCQQAAALFDRPVSFVPNSVDSQAFKPETRDNTLARSIGIEDETVLGFVGELREKKGLRFLLPAFAEVAKRRPARLLLVGGIRADAREAWQAFTAAAPEAAARVTVLDYKRSPKRLSRLLALCDLLVFPSLYEGLPNAVLEAMAAGRPVLATQVGGHRDLIEHGSTGALLPLSELDRLPEAIEEVLDLPASERASLGQAARSAVAARFTPEAEGTAYARVYADARAAFTAS